MTTAKASKQNLNTTKIEFLVLIILFITVASIVVIFLRATSKALGELVSLPIKSETGQSLLFLVAVAFVTMCLIQAIRSLVRVRGWFHIHEIENWFRETERVIAAANGPQQFENAPDLEAEVARDLAVLTRLANVDDALAFFDAPIEQVCGQISAVTEFLLSELTQVERNEPASTTRSQWANVENDANLEDRHLLALLTGKSSVLNAGKLLAISWNVSRSSKTSATDHMANPPIPVTLPVAQKTDVRSTLAFQLQRSLDQLQIKVASRWQRLLRLTAVIMSCTISLSATHLSRLFVTKQADHSDLAAVAVAMMAGIVSGYVATVFRDMISIIERRRR